MGALIPQTDHKLGKPCDPVIAYVSNNVVGAIESIDQLNINTASDFMAQYTTRQEYRFTEALQDASSNDLDFGLRKFGDDMKSAVY